MKEILLIILLISGLNLFAQDNDTLVPVDPDDKKIRFREVVDENGAKDELFKRCVYWLNGFYKDPTRITTIRDKPTGKIAGRHQFRIYYNADNAKNVAGMIKYTFTIELKDDKYRYTVDNFVLRSSTNMPVEKWLNKDDPAYDQRWEEYLKQIAEYVNGWSSSLKQKMKPENEKKADDW